MSLRPAAALSDNVRAALFMLLSMGGFVLNDVMVKIASADMPPPQIMAIRGSIATLLLLGLAYWRGALRPFALVLRPVVLLRTGADVMATITYITALRHMPIANASAILQALPLTVTVGAALFLREEVGGRRWAAIAVGFVGVMIIVRPGGDGFTAFSLVVLASVLFCAVRDLSTRRMSADIPTFFIALVTATANGLTGLILSPFYDFVPVEPVHVAILGFSAMALAVGYICIVTAMRLGDTGFVAPFRYSVLIYALLLGFVVFGDVPDATVLAGSAIVVGSGGYMLYRERVRGRALTANTGVR